MTDLIDCCEEERKKSLRRAKALRYRTSPKGQLRTRAYKQREYVKERERRYRQRPEVKARQKAYGQRPEQKEKQRAYSRRPDVIKKRNERTREWRRRPDVKVRHRAQVRARVLMRKYGITEAQYDAMLVIQGGVCAICNRPPKTLRLAVDHDHKTGRVRGLACFQCNRDRIGRNTVETARKVLAYLESDFDGRKIVA